MSLPARQRRALDAIERALRASEPRLNGMFAIFARLTREEEPVRAERLPRRRLSRLRPRGNIVLIHALAGLVFITGMVIGLSTGRASACGPASAGAHAWRPAFTCTQAHRPPSPSPGPTTRNAVIFHG
jgi:hypothetical protein